jgi:hypothetical protein
VAEPGHDPQSIISADEKAVFKIPVSFSFPKPQISATFGHHLIQSNVIP